MFHSVLPGKISGLVLIPLVKSPAPATSEFYEKSHYLFYLVSTDSLSSPLHLGNIWGLTGLFLSRIINKQISYFLDAYMFIYAQCTSTDHNKKRRQMPCSHFLAYFHKEDSTQRNTLLVEPCFLCLSPRFCGPVCF